MRRLVILALGLLSLVATGRMAYADDTLKVAVPQKGAWDAGLVELGQRDGIFKKHGLDLDILYTSAGPESIQAAHRRQHRCRRRLGRIGRDRHFRQGRADPHYLE